MKTTLLTLLLFICFTASSQINAKIINADYIVTTIDHGIESALHEIEEAQYELENLCLTFDIEADLRKADKIRYSSKIDLIEAKEKVQIELLGVIEKLDKNEYQYEKIYEKKINEWNETMFALENLDIQPLM